MVCTDNLQNVNTKRVKQLQSNHLGHLRPAGMAAAGTAAGPSTSKKVLDLDIYSDLKQNDEVSLTF